MRISFRPTRIDRYVTSEILGPLLGSVVFFSFILLMFQALRLADFFIVHGIPGTVILKLVLLLVVSFMPMALPIAFLIAVLVGFGRLSADSELVAMKACGVGLKRLSIPAFGISLGIVFISLLLNLEWVPLSLQNYRRTVVKVGNTQVVSSIQQGTFTPGFFDLLIFVDHVDPGTNLLKRVFIFDEREEKNPVAVVAREGELLQVKSESELAASAVLMLHHGNIHSNDIEEETYQKIDFTDYRLFLSVDEGEDTTSEFKPRMMTFGQLRNAIEETKPNSQHNRELRTEYWRRFSIALSGMIFVLIGMGYGTIRTRSVKSGAALIALIVVLLYWGIQVGTTSLAYQGKISPFLAMQLPNIITLIGGLIAFKKASW